MRQWDYACRFYYGRNAKAPRVPGDLALETRHSDLVSKDMEISAGLCRHDIGRIEVRDLRTVDSPWHVVYDELVKRIN